MLDGGPLQPARNGAARKQSIPDGSKFDDLRAADLACAREGDDPEDGEEPLIDA